jgi:hypothetical protein
MGSLRQMGPQGNCGFCGDQGIQVAWVVIGDYSV